MPRNDVVDLATRAVYGGGSDDAYQTLDVAIREAALKTGRTVQETADLLRLEAFAGDHYRGQRYDEKEDT